MMRVRFEVDIEDDNDVFRVYDLLESFGLLLDGSIGVGGQSRVDKWDPSSDKLDLRKFMYEHRTSAAGIEDDRADHNVAVECGGEALLCMTCNERWELPVGS